MTTVARIVEETRQWPCEQLAELVDRLTLSLHHRVDPGIDGAWEQETRRRIAEIESGKVCGVPGEDVAQRVRKIVGR